MKTKPKPKKVVIPSSDREEHELLREALSNHEPRFYGDLRRKFNLAPHRLEYELFTYPEIFEARESDDGRPMIRLREGKLPSREEILMKRQLIKTVRAAGSNGIYLRTLYSNLGYESKLVERILAGVPEVEAALEKNKKLSCTDGPPNKIQSASRNLKNLGFTDMSSQKSSTAFEDPAPRLAVQPALPKPTAPMEEPLTPASVPQAREFSDAEYAEPKFRAGAPGMALRRGGAKAPDIVGSEDQRRLSLFTRLREQAYHFPRIFFIQVSKLESSDFDAAPLSIDRINQDLRRLRSSMRHSHV